MAAVAEMGEVDEMHSNEEGIVLNGDVTKDIDVEHRDVEMENKDVDKDKVTVNKIPQDELTNNKDVSVDDSKHINMDGKDVDMDSKDEESAVDEDSQDSRDSQISQEEKSQGSPDSSMETEQINEENASSHDENEDTNTNSSMPQNENSDLRQSEQHNENSNVSSRKNDEDEDSRSSTEETSEQKAQEQDPLFNETNEDGPEESDKKRQHEDPDQEVSRDGSESKSEHGRDEPSENGTEERAASVASSAVSVHEIEDDDRHDKLKAHETIELNESEDDGDVMIVDGPKTNGTTEVIDLIDTTPEKKVKEKKEKESITPRRSSRNLNKSKSYVESDKEDTPPPPPVEPEEESEESDIEEIMPQDPLAVNDQITVERIPSVKKVTPPETTATIVVKDTKRLVEIASKTNQNTSSSSGSSTPQQGKKEPTLVIIDTNSILSGRGPVPVPAKSVQPVTVSTANFNSMLPVAVPAQGMYPANMRATITPIPVNTVSQKVSSVIASMHNPTAPLLPTLTDDMFVVEAPSFIVPYVYEKPPVKVLKEFVADIKKQIQENKTKKQ